MEDYVHRVGRTGRAGRTGEFRLDLFIIMKKSFFRLCYFISHTRKLGQCRSTHQNSRRSWTGY